MKVAMRCRCGATFEAEDGDSYSTSAEREGEKWCKEHALCNSDLWDGRLPYANFIAEAPRDA